MQSVGRRLRPACPTERAGPPAPPNLDPLGSWTVDADRLTGLTDVGGSRRSVSAIAWRGGYRRDVVACGADPAPHAAQPRNTSAPGRSTPNRLTGFSHLGGGMSWPVLNFAWHAR